MDIDMDASDEGPVPDGASAAPEISETSPDEARAEKKSKKPKVKKVRAPRQGPLVPPAVGAVAAGLGAVVFFGGLLFFLWAGQILPLNSLLLPVVEENTEIRPPYSSLGRDAPDTARLLEKAGEQAEINPVEAAVLLQRVLNQGPSDKATERLDYIHATMGVRGE
jgi:hypothetical protein